MAAKSLGEMMKVLSSWEWSISCWMRIVWNFKSIWVVAVVLFYFKKEWNDINQATADFMLEQPWLSLFFYPYKRDCSADYVEQTEYDSDSENILQLHGYCCWWSRSGTSGKSIGKSRDAGVAQFAGKDDEVINSISKWVYLLCIWRIYLHQIYWNLHHLALKWWR